MAPRRAEGDPKHRKKRASTEAESGKYTHLVPHILPEVDARRAPLDAAAVHENVDVSVHGFECAAEKTADGVEIREVAFDGLDICLLCRLGRRGLLGLPSPDLLDDAERVDISSGTNGKAD